MGRTLTSLWISSSCVTTENSTEGQDGPFQSHSDRPEMANEGLVLDAPPSPSGPSKGVIPERGSTVPVSGPACGFNQATTDSVEAQRDTLRVEGFPEEVIDSHTIL